VFTNATIPGGTAAQQLAEEPATTATAAACKPVPLQPSFVRLLRPRAIATDDWLQLAS